MKPNDEKILTARDYKTLWLATLGGVLEFYDFIIFIFFANTIGNLFFLPGFQTGFGSSRRSEFSLVERA